MRRPLVLTASAAAIEQARALGIARPLENVIEEAILRGDLAGVNVGGESAVRVGGGVIVVCKKVRVEPSQRKGWRALAVRRVDQRRVA